MRVRFGEFVFDSRLRELRERGEIAHLTPKTFRLLEALLEARPEPLSKEALYEHLWPATFVEDNGLKMLVSVLRIVLHDDARNPKWLKTVYGFGYAFAGEGVADLDPSADDAPGTMMLRLLMGPNAYALRPGVNVLGREEDCQVVVDSTSVSRHHAAIVVRGDDAVIEDLASKNGTFIGRRRVDAPAGLHDGDTIRLGSVSLTFSARPRSVSTATHVAS